MMNLSTPRCEAFQGLFLALLVFAAGGTERTGAVEEGEDHPDRMRWLPGYPHLLPSPWYSGYLDYQIDGVDIHTHYIYIEAETTENDTDGTPPLIYWTNGGPGASSMFGLLTELGPLVLSDLSLQTHEYEETGIPTPLFNPYSWTKLGNLLLVDAPAPVGFSYCNDHLAGDGYSCLSWTDELASLNTYTALQTFFDEKFPSLGNSSLYLTGESYAGIYIPTLARRILEGRSKVPMNLRGFAVGDPCLGTNTPVCGNLGIANDSWETTYFGLLFLAGHGQIPLTDYHRVMEICTEYNNEEDGVNGELRSNHAKTSTGDSNQDSMTSNIPAKCREEVEAIMDEVGGYFEYSLYDECTYRNGLLLRHNLDRLKSTSDPLGEAAIHDYPCGGGPVMDAYLSRKVVKEAFNVQEDAVFFDVDNAESFDYTPTERDLRPFYRDVASGKYGTAIRVLVYNGDTDPAITSFATQAWMAELGMDEVRSWRPWTIDGCQRMGGYVTRYEGNLDFLTIRGAGHLVPTYKPDASFAFIKAWINGEDYPAYDKECSSPPLIQHRIQDGM